MRIKYRPALLIMAGILILALLTGMFTLAEPLSQMLAQMTAPKPIVPPEVTENLTGWPLPNQNYANTREVTQSGINLNTVAQLGVAWQFTIPGKGQHGYATSNPIIVGNQVYFEDLASGLFALNLDDGTVLWKNEPELPAYGPNGPAVGWNKVFAIVGQSRIAAYDRADGKELWNVDLRTQGEVEGVTIQPLVYDGLVYVSTVPGSTTRNFYQDKVAGILYALNADTGAVVWKFNTIESSDGWANLHERNNGGGAWYPPAVDTATGMLYFGIGNPGPWPGIEGYPNGSSRPGDNLYTNSLVALTHQNGVLQWYKQIVPHDLFDFDFQISPILTTATIDGSPRDIIIGAGKMGKVFAFDRKTGDILWERAVGAHLNDDVTAVPEGMEIVVLPGPNGGIETSLALSDGLIFVPFANKAAHYTSTGIFGFPQSPATGGITAVDVNTGLAVWTLDFPEPNFGAATVVNDLVFTATFDGKIYAINAKTGEIAWQWKAPAGINGWPAVSGDSIIWPAGNGRRPAVVALRLNAPGGPAVTPEATATEIAPTATAAASTPAAAGIIEVNMVDFDFQMPMTIRAGHTQFKITNSGTVAHEFRIDGEGIDQALGQDVDAGQTFTLDVDLKPGTYEVICDILGHAELGMKMTLTVVS